MTKQISDIEILQYEHRQLLALARLLKAGVFERHRLRLEEFGTQGISLGSFLMQSRWLTNHGLRLEFSQTATPELIGDVLSTLNPPTEDSMFNIEVWQDFGPNYFAVMDLAVIIQKNVKTSRSKNSSVVVAGPHLKEKIVSENSILEFT